MRRTLGGGPYLIDRGPKQLATAALVRGMVEAGVQCDCLLGSRKGHAAYEAIEVVCKGPEVSLPKGISFEDKGGKVRHEVCIRWWQEDLSTYRKAAIGPPGDMEMIPDVALPLEWKASPYAGPPVIFGHYWFSGQPTVISERFACLDFSVAKGGPLVAYRWDGEAQLSTAKWAWV